jgi:hypothetical protein
LLFASFNSIVEVLEDPTQLRRQLSAHGAFAGAHEPDQDYGSHLGQRTDHFGTPDQPSACDLADLQEAVRTKNELLLLVIGAFSEMNLTTEGPQHHGG